MGHFVFCLSLQALRDSCSSHESRKSSGSHRSSEEDAVDVDSGCRTDSNGKQEAGKRTSSHTRTPSSERQFGSTSEGCSKEGSSDGAGQCRYSCCPSREAREPRRLRHPHAKSKSHCRESYASEDSRSYKNGSTGSVEEEKRMEEKKAEEKVVCLPLGRNTLYTDIETDSTKEWKTTRDRDYTKLRNVEKISLNGAQIWRERGQPRGRINSGTDSGVSPPRRSLRSLTPDQDSISFHESLGQELSRRRRSRRRSASCSSACGEEESGGGGGGGGRRAKRLDSANSTHSITGASSRNSSSKSEKSSSRSSRSPSLEFNKRGNQSILHF